MQRKIFKHYLREVLKIQMLAFEHGLNVSTWLRDSNKSGEEWIVGDVYPEGMDFTKYREGEDYFRFYIYDWYSTEKLDAEITKVREWILSHGVEIVKPTKDTKQ